MHKQIELLSDDAGCFLKIDDSQKRPPLDSIPVEGQAFHRLQGMMALHGQIVTQLSLFVVLGEVVRGPVEGRFPRVGQGFAEFGLEVRSGVLLR